MYTVILRSKTTGQKEGYLGTYNSLEEAEDIVYRFNLKADRHPSIAEIDGIYDESIADDSTETFDMEDSEESEDYSEEYSEESDEKTTFMFHNQLKENKKRNNPVRENPFMFASERRSEPKETNGNSRVMGIMFDDNGWVLMRKPSNGYMNIKWEFYGGNIDYNERKEDAVIRETREETGFNSEIISSLGIFRAKNIKYYVFLLEKTSEQQRWTDYGGDNQETEETVFVPVYEAESMIRQNKDRDYSKMLLKALSEAAHRWKMRQYK